MNNSHSGNPVSTATTGGCPIHRNLRASLQSPVAEMLLEPAPRTFNRRTALKLAAVGLASLATLGVLEANGVPVRVAEAAPPPRPHNPPPPAGHNPPPPLHQFQPSSAALPNIQYDLSAFIPPAQTIAGIPFRFGPVYTIFATARLNRTPNRQDQQLLSQALNEIENNYPFNPGGAFVAVSYGLPYFRRLPSSLVASHIPRLADAPNRGAFEEAQPGPTDVSPANPAISKQRFNVPVVIENNDMLFSVRSDQLANLLDILGWLSGSNTLAGHTLSSPAFANLFSFTSTRLMFGQQGMPRQVADKHNLGYANQINPQSPMWMGFADQQVSGAGPAAITTFQGNASARLTTIRNGDYFIDGSIQHLAHDILDLAQFYDKSEPYTERVQYMFRSNPIPSVGNTDQFTNGGGPTFLKNVYQGRGDALKNAQAVNTFEGEHRMGHLAALQRSSRAADGTPIHIRADGPGFDSMDVPDNTNQPKLQFSIYLPTSEFFRTMRDNAASLDLVKANKVAAEDNGLERFITATRRQNYLVPPRQHRAFPLVELS